ncbi:MAG: 50S ribosomal protein L11 methyltransferase, partial [Duncaniella sp.]|nr:50S ribosomal protein L11 methyltransferase [Duncaniella sp.]
MNDYTEVRLDLSPCSEIHTDILAAMLAEAGYESFVPDADGLTAYIRKEDFNSSALDGIIREFPMETSITAKHTVVEG